MLHIFWIHSHITFLVAKEIIANIGNNQEVIIFLSRRYELPDIFDLKENVEIISSPWFRDKSNANILIKSDILKTRSNVKLCVNFFNEYINNRAFILYAPTSWEYAVALMMKHEKCIGYYYIEEGVLAYLKNGNKERASKFREFLIKYIYNLPYLGMYGVLNNFRGSFAVSKKAFLWHTKERNIVDIKNRSSTYYQEYLQYKTILIFDHLPFSIDELNEYLVMLKEVLNCNNINKFLFKFHPATKGSLNEQIVRTFMKDFNAKETSPHFIVELFIRQNPMSIYFINTKSSILLYTDNTESKCFHIKRSEKNSGLEIVNLYNEI